MLFHVQEEPADDSGDQELHRRARVANSSASNSTPPALQQFRALFAANGWSMTDLDQWHAVETQYPDTFSGMYQSMGAEKLTAAPHWPHKI